MAEINGGCSRGRARSAARRRAYQRRDGRSRPKLALGPRLQRPPTQRSARGANGLVPPHHRQGVRGAPSLLASYALALASALR